MIFNFTDKDHLMMEEILDYKELSLSSVELLSYYLNNDERVLKGNKFDSFLSLLSLDKNDDVEALVRYNKINEFKELKQGDYLSNPYFKLISKVRIKQGKYSLTHLFYEQDEAFVYDEIQIDPETYSEITPMGYFKEKFIYPALIHDDAIWMSLIPHEINTMKDSINEAHNNVLVMGLGLGYYAYMVSRKENVKKVTVLEKDKNIINIFKTYLLPLFENKEKIEIIEIDAKEYKYTSKDYDYVFIDLWHNVHDGLPLYLYFKKNEVNDITYSYWIETSLIAMVRRMLLTIYEENVIYKYTKKDYLKSENENDEIINSLYFLTENFTFNNVDEFLLFLRDDNLKKIIKDIE